MEVDTRAGASGLRTDQNPLEQDGRGMLVADNVIAARHGELQPRPGFKDAGFSSLPSATFTRIVSAFGAGLPSEDLLFVASNGKLYSSDGTEIQLNGASLNLGTTPADCDFAQARGSVYVAGHTSGIVKIEDISGPTTARAGMMAPILTRNSWSTLDESATTPNTAVDNNKWLGYRAVLRREDGNGLVLRSAPSMLAGNQNTDGATRNVQIWVHLPDTAAVGDVVELYRTENMDTSSVGETFRLAVEQTLVAGDVTLRAVQITDRRKDAQLGAVLYTSPSQEGAENANDPPPYAKRLASFEGSLFFGDVVTRQTFTTHIARISGRNYGGGALAATEDGIAAVEKTACTIPAAPNDDKITVPDTNHIRVGQVVSDGVGGPLTNANYGSTPVKVIAIVSGTQVQVDKTGTPGSGLTMRFHDVLAISDGATTEEYYAHHAIDASEDAYGLDTTGSTTDADGRRTATARGIGWLMAENDAQGGSAFITPKPWLYKSITAGDHGFFAMLENGVNGATLTVTTTSPSTAFDPEIPSAGQVFEVASWPDAIFWSKQDQPEHVPLGNYARVGDEGSPILALVPTDNCLWIFKEDGLFRLTGEGADAGWRIDEVDRGLRLIYETAWAVAEREVICWTNRGVVGVSDSGIRQLSTPVIDLELRDTARAFIASTGVAQAAAKENEYFVLGVGASSTLTDIYCLSLRTMEWTKWVIGATSIEPDTAFVLHRVDDLLYVAGDSGVCWVERNAGDATDVSDRSWSVTIDSINGTTITLTSAPAGMTVAVGDAIYDGASGLGVVTSVTSTTIFDVHDASGFGEPGGATVYEAFQCDMRWVDQHGEHPGLGKLWTEASPVFSQVPNLYSVTMKATSDTGETESSASRILTPFDTDDENGVVAFPRILRSAVARGHARSAMLRPELSILNAMSRWRVRGLALKYVIESAVEGDQE